MLQVLNGLKQAAEGAVEAVNGTNPWITQMKDARNEEIANTLLKLGFTKDEIMDFVDVSRLQAENHLSKREEFLKWQAEEAKAKPRTKRSA